ncbi:MAG: beta-ketoacyl-ACP synthase 3 [Actinomycetota bacterium]|nr:beta-ketoacyl-ACP synthase 3 [Actinomycetota bacterium]
MVPLPEVAPGPDTVGATTQRTAGVLGLGAALPDAVVGNEEIATRLGVDSEWIVRRTGIHERRWAAPDASLDELAADAGRAALADAELDAGELDYVLVATMSADSVTPNAAPVVAHLLGAKGAGAMDIGAACTGALSAMAAACGLIESGRAEHILVIGAELLSRHTDPDDRRTAALFGDGAGALVLSATADGHIGPVVLGADGGRADLITADRVNGNIQMNGHDTFVNAIQRLGEGTLQACAAADTELAEIDLFVYHQANGRILSAAAERLAVPTEKVLDCIASVGNTSAASVPLALQEARVRGLLAPGSRVLLGAVGAGFTWGAAVVEWGSA